ncbi:MFS transporter [Thermodesulfobacteriota bacterium]
MSTRTKLLWVSILYFAEGFPFGLVQDAIPVYMRFQGIGLSSIGLVSLAGLPWTLKFFWAPAVDLLGTRKTWIVGCQVLLSASLLFFVVMNPTQGGFFLWLVMVLAVFSATQDIAVDAYTIEILEKEEMGPANGLRVTAYRIAMIAAGGLFVALAGWVGWGSAFGIASLLMAIYAVTSSRAPARGPEFQSAGEIPATRESLAMKVWTPLAELYRRPGFVPVMVFILLFKLGDMALAPMVRPFWVDRGFTPLEIGVVPGTLGVIFTIIGALLGGALTRRLGIFTALWILGLAQAGSNLFYAAAASLPPSTALMYTASAVESFCGGLGTAPFLAFLMSICDRRYAATQYALMTALFGLARSVSGACSGYATEHLGYAAYFLASFFMAFPAYCLLPRVRKWLS